MKKKIRYIHEVYTDEFRTLFQAIEIDVKLDKESKGCYSKELRRLVNPNLQILLRKDYLTYDYKLVKEEIIGVSNERKN